MLSLTCLKMKSKRQRLDSQEDFTQLGLGALGIQKGEMLLQRGLQAS